METLDVFDALVANCHNDEPLIANPARRAMLDLARLADLPAAVSERLRGEVQAVQASPEVQTPRTEVAFALRDMERACAKAFSKPR